MVAVQAKAANAQASDVRQQGYLMAALQGALDKAKPVWHLLTLLPYLTANLLYIKFYIQVVA